MKSREAVQCLLSRAHRILETKLDHKKFVLYVLIL